jgi:hypothetical protein
LIAAEEDTGPIVQALLQENAGKNVIGYREWITLRELADAFTQATGIKAEYIMLPNGQSNIPLPPDLQLELDDNWAYCNEFGYEGRDDPTIIHPKDVSLRATSSSFQLLTFLVGLAPAAGQCDKLLQEAGLVQSLERLTNSVLQELLHRKKLFISCASLIQPFGVWLIWLSSPTLRLLLSELETDVY